MTKIGSFSNSKLGKGIQSPGKSWDLEVEGADEGSKDKLYQLSLLSWGPVPTQFLFHFADK